MSNLDVDFEHLYIIINPTKNDIDFETVYPILPAYFWSSNEGKKLRLEINNKLLQNFKHYLEEEPNYQSYKSQTSSGPNIY